MRSAAEMKAFPPADERQQAMCIGVQSLVGNSADILAIEIPIDPRNTLPVDCSTT